MDFTHPKIITEEEFYEFMINKLELNNHSESYIKYIDMIYVLLDKQNSPKWCEYHHLNLSNLKKFETLIDGIKKYNSVLDIFGEIIFKLLTENNIITFDEYNRLNRCGFKIEYHVMAEPYDILSKEQFKNKLKIYINNWTIY